MGYDRDKTIPFSPDDLVGVDIVENDEERRLAFRGHRGS